MTMHSSEPRYEHQQMWLRWMLLKSHVQFQGWRWVEIHVYGICQWSSTWLVSGARIYMFQLTLPVYKQLQHVNNYTKPSMVWICRSSSLWCADMLVWICMCNYEISTLLTWCSHCVCWIQCVRHMHQQRIAVLWSTVGNSDFVGAEISVSSPKMMLSVMKTKSLGGSQIRSTHHSQWSRLCRNPAS